MKILINAGYFNNIPCADNNIEVDLAREFIIQGHECEIIGATYDVEDEIQKINEITVHKIPYAKRIVVKARETTKKYFNTDGFHPITVKEKLSFYVAHPIYALVLQLNKIAFFRSHMLSNYVNEVQKLINQGNFDVLIGVVYSFEQTEKCFEKVDVAKKIYYQLDPFGLYEIKNQEMQNSDIDREVQTMMKSDVVFTTNELYVAYSQTTQYASVLPRMVALGFPSFHLLKENNEKKSAFVFDLDEINILFCGTIDDFHRNPVKTFELFEWMMIRDNRIHLYILGNFDSELGKEYIKNHKMNISLHKAVDSLEAEKTMREADILLNIGNTDKFMVPSKIFAYFATGKPLINICRRKDSPAEKYFSSYPLHYTVDENGLEQDKEELLKYIVNSKGVFANSDEVKRAYEENTARYTAKKMLERMH